MKYYLTDDSKGNKTIISLDNLRSVYVQTVYDDTVYLKFCYSGEADIQSIGVIALERANLLIEDIYRVLEESEKKVDYANDAPIPF